VTQVMANGVIDVLDGPGLTLQNLHEMRRSVQQRTGDAEPGVVSPTLPQDVRQI
jgi:hypothetical protein